MRIVMRSCILLLLLLTGCEEVLYDNLSQREANQLLTTLRQAGIQAERVKDGDGTFSVRVDEDKFAESIRLLEQRGLPRERFETMADVFASDSLLSTPLEERARLAYALSQELTGSLTAVGGILDAHVHLTLSKDLPLSNKTTPATASVLINHAPGFDVEAIVPDVKFLVAKGVPNLNYRDVTVVTVPEHQWEVSETSGLRHREFLGIRFVDQDANRFAALIGFLGAALVFTLFLLVFVLVRFGLMRKPALEDAKRWLPAVTNNGSGMRNLATRWLKGKVTSS